MKLSIFRQFIIIILTFWVKIRELFIAPLLHLIAFFWRSGFVFERIKFEQAIEEDFFTSFAVSRQNATTLFHVSSEGELEQVLPLIEELITKNKLVELVYTSPSVDKKCRKLAKQNWPALRILPLPLLGTLADVDLLFWSTAHQVVMCRYDFFPEMLLLVLKAKSSVLVSASIKKYTKALSISFSVSNLYWKVIFNLFHFIIPASHMDQKIIKRLTSSQVLPPFDFRILQIFTRLEHSEELIKQDLGSAFINLVQSKNSLIIGSGWEDEIFAICSDEIIEDIKKGKLLCYFAPHSLGDDFYKLFLNLLDKIEVPVYLIGRDMSVENINKLLLEYQKEPGILYSQKAGILCELYSFFQIALVGGGWGRSIHSVLEPFLANCFVCCGPKIFRSTEIDMIQNWKEDEVTILQYPSELLDCLQHYLSLEGDKKLRFSLYQQVQTEYDMLIKELFYGS